VDIIVSNVVVVENNDEYNGIEAVDWTPVYSVVNCTKGNGVMKWKCLSDGKFDGVLPDVSECWINDILDKIDNITQFEVLEFKIQ
jgi:hypothetical protein